MENEERVIVRLSSDELLLLSELVNRHEFGSPADAVRSAVASLLESRFSPEERAEVLERLRARAELDLNDFTADGTDAGKVLTDVIAKGLETDRKDD